METISHCTVCPIILKKNVEDIKKAYLTFSSVNSWAFTAEVILWYAVLPSSRLQPALMQTAEAAV